MLDRHRPFVIKPPFERTVNDPLTLAVSDAQRKLVNRLKVQNPKPPILHALMAKASSRPATPELAKWVIELCIQYELYEEADAIKKLIE